MEYFDSAAQRLEVRKRILLADGPGRRRQVDDRQHAQAGPGKVLAEQRAGAVYAIKGCPMHEEPLHLIPDELRAEMRARVRHLHRGRPLPALPRRCSRTSTAARSRTCSSSGSSSPRRTACGIGTFAPSDPKSQDISELTGCIDLSTIGEYGVESDPRAYRFDGELNIANRGLMEFIEMLKCDEKFLYACSRCRRSRTSRPAASR